MFLAVQTRLVSRALYNTEFSDITLKCEDKTFPCHKVILSARSDVFAAMFSHRDTKEDNTNEVEIEDLDAETLGHLLQFVYTDK